MTSSISVLAAFADGVILLALVAAAASPRVSPLARPLIASFALACAWALTAVFDALRAPGWTMLMGGAVIAVSIMVITVTIHLWTLGGGNESSLGQRGDQGGGGPRRRRPDAPRRGGGGSDPSWWPEFERQLAFYVAVRDREKRLTNTKRHRSTSSTSLRGPAYRALAANGARLSLDGRFVPVGKVVLAALPANAGPVPDRLTIWPVDDGRYGPDATFQGDSSYL